MKLNILLAVLVAVLGWATCKNLKNSGNETPAERSTSGTSDQNPSGPGAPAPSNVPQAYVDVPIDALPPASASHKAYLSTGYWHLNTALQANDTTVHHNYQHKWLKFREDQTFDILIKGKTVESGRWNWDAAKNEIYISCKDPWLNNSWAVINKGFIMIWKGNTSFNTTGIQIRVVGAGNLPSSF